MLLTPGGPGQPRSHVALWMVLRWGRWGLTWPLDWLLGGCVFPLVGDGGGVGDPGGRTALREMLLQAFDGTVQLAGADLVVDVHEI